MKKMYLNLLTALAISSLASSQAFARTYLQNNYGADVEYIEINPALAAHKHYSSYVKKVANGTKVVLTDFFNKGELSLCKVGGNFQDVSGIINQINNEQNQHQNESSVITINYSFNPLYWSLSLSWIRE
jgi:hypothetical protein